MSQLLFRLVAGVSFLIQFGGSVHAAEPFSLQRTWVGESTLDQFGIAVAGVGDLDGDGREDVVVGANVHDSGATSAGRAYRFHGASPLPTVHDLAVDGSELRGYLGQALAGGGDFDGDGYADWAVGAPGPGGDGTRPGSVFVILGGPAADSEPDLRVDGVVAGGQFGAALDLRGDLDGDGRADLVIGAPRAGAGEVAIVWGHEITSPVKAPDRVLRPDSSDDDRFGFAVATLGDADGDGRDELLIGAPRSSRVATWAGAVLVHFGTATLDSVPDLVLLGVEGGEEFGRAIATGGDLDGDGSYDVVVGAPFANSNGLLDSGRAVVFRGGIDFDVFADAGVVGEAVDDRFGTAVASGFDWDGDGTDDLAAGAPGHSSVASMAGAVYVFAGMPSVGANPIHVERPVITSGYLGTSLANGGDVFGAASAGRGSLLAGGYEAGGAGRVLAFASESSATSAPATAARVHLSAPRPNPFNPRTVFELTVSRAADWTVAAFDSRGRRVSTLWSGPLDPGTHPIVWDALDPRGADLPSGVYFVRASDGRDVTSRRAVLIR